MQLLMQVQPETSKSLELEDYMFHYINMKNLLVLCMADKKVEKKLAFTFLQDIRKTFEDTYSAHDIQAAKGYSLKSFGVETLKPKMQAYNDNPEMFNDKADQLLKDMLHLKDNMVENIESLIQRDGKIEVVAEKAMQLSTVSNSYKTRSRKLKEQERRKRYCMIMTVCIVVTILIGVICWVVLGSMGGDDADDDSKAFVEYQESTRYFSP